VGKNYITFCRHPCPPPDLLDIEQDPEELSHDKQQQYIFSEKPISQIQEFSKGQLDEIIMLPTPVPLLSAYETSKQKNEQQQSIVETQLPSLTGKSNSDLFREVVGDHQENKEVDRVRTYEEEDLHELQSQPGQINDEISKPIPFNMNDEQAHQLINSQDYHGHEEHVDYNQQHQHQQQQQQQIEDYSQQDDYPEHNRNQQQQVISESDNARETESDGIDYGYDDDSQEETPASADQKPIHPTQNEHKQHDLADISDTQQQEVRQHLEAPSDDFYHQQQGRQEFGELPAEDYHHEQQLHSQPSESESDEYYRQQQQQQEFPTALPEDYRHEQQ
ncbi:hypothetical protein LOAG_15840, partial [Loa loa]